MKKIKLAAMFAAVVAMLGFSSCLGGDTPNIATGMEFVQVNSGIAGYYSFKNSAGFNLEPGNQKQWAETTISTPFVIIQYQYSPDSIKQNSKRMPITLQGMAPVEEAGMMDPANWANSPIYAAGLTAFPYFDKNNLFMGVQYYVKKGTDGKIDASEQAAHIHQFALLCEKDKDKSISGNNLVLYLVHKAENLDINKDRKSSDGFEYVHFGLYEALTWFKEQKSNLPENLIIKYKVPGKISGEDMLDYESAKDGSQPVTIPYAKYFKESK